MATSFGLGDEPVIIGEDIYTQEDVQKAVRGAGYLGTPSYTQEDVQKAVMDAGYLDAPPEFSQQGAIAQLEADLMNDIMIRDQLREEELLGQQNLKTVNTIPPVSTKKVVLYGDDAVKQVEKLEGRPLTYDEQFVVREEGFVNAPYKDTKGIITYGVGQTGNWINKSFSEAYEAHKEEARKLIPSFDNLSKELQAALMSAVYRGDLQQSPDFRKLFNAGKYIEASKEFLDNDDYRASVKSGDGVHKRMERVANIVKNAV